MAIDNNDLLDFPNVHSNYTIILFKTKNSCQKLHQKTIRSIEILIPPNVLTQKRSKGRIDYPKKPELHGHTEIDHQSNGLVAVGTR
jgi:hypothetical protein